MDTRIKSYADAIYDRSMMKSVADCSSAKVAYLNQRAARNPTVYMPLGGTDIQALVRLSAEHIERCMASRLVSYQEAYKEAGRVPTDQEFTEIFNDFKGVRERELRNSSAAIGQLTISMGPTNPGKARGLLDSASARAHDRVLRDWKVWREQTRLQQSAKEPPPTAPYEKLKRDDGAIQWITGRLWRWEVIGIGSPALYGAGIAAMYGDDYWVAVALYASGIGLPAAKILLSEEARAHKKRVTLRFLVLLSSLLLIATSFLWISHRRKQHLAESPVSPLKAQSISAQRQPPDHQPTSPQVATPGPGASNQKPDGGQRKKPASPRDGQGDAITRTVEDVISGQLRVDPAKVVPSARLKEDLGADYLDKLELEMGIEGAFDIHIEAAEWINVRTVQDVDNYVRAHFKGAKKATSD